MNDILIIEVLCVDDEDSFLEMEREFLERCGPIAVDMADSVPSALDKMRTKRYDAVVSDYQMPGPSGIDLLRFIRGQGDVTPFILFTGHGENEVAIEALSEGATFYMEKGGEPQSQFIELADMIKSSVELSRVRGDAGALKDKVAFARATGDNVVIVLDRSGRIVDCNNRSEMMTGYSKSELIGMDVMELVTLGRVRPHPNFRNPAFDRESGLGCEVKLIRRDCSESRVIISSAAVRRGPTNNLVGSIWVISDLLPEDEIDIEMDL